MDKVKLINMNPCSNVTRWWTGGGVEHHVIVLKNQDYKMNPKQKGIMIYSKL